MSNKVCQDIQARCPECGNYVLWLMDRPPSRRVVEIQPISAKRLLDGTIEYRWKKHLCKVGNEYQRGRLYRWDLWGYGHEIVEGHWYP